MRAAVVAVALLLPAAANAAVHTVTTTADAGPGSLRAAFAAAATDGGDSTIDVQVAGTVFVGSTSGLALPDPGEPGFTLTVLGNGLVLDGSALQVLPLPARNGIDLSSGGLIDIRDLGIRQFPDHGVRIFGSVAGGELNGIVVQDNKKSGILIEGAFLGPLTVRNAWVEGNADDGITFSGTAGHRVTASQVRANDTNGIKLSSGSSGIVIDLNPDIGDNFQAGVLITQGSWGNDVGPGNTLARNRRGGVQIEFAGSDNNRVLGNTAIDDNGFAGVSIGAAAAGGLVDGNMSISGNTGAGVLIADAVNAMVRGNPAIVGNFFGVQIFGSSDVTIGTLGAGNTISGNGAGLEIGGASLRVQADANTLAQNGSYGVSVGGTSSDVDLGQASAGNLIEQHTGSGVPGLRVVGTASAVRVVEATIRQNGIGVLIKDAAADVEIVDSLIETSTAEGVRIEGSADDLLIGPGNTVRFNASCGIRIAGGADITVTGNLDIAQNARCGVAQNGGTGPVLIAGNVIRNHGSRPSSLGLAGLDERGVGVVRFGGGPLTFGPGNRVQANVIGLLAGSAAGLVVSGNTAPEGFLSNTGAGVSLVETTAAQVLSSRFQGNTVGLVQRGGGTLVNGNTFDGQSGPGARLEGGHWDVQGNTFTGNGDRGLRAALYDAPNGSGLPDADLNLADDLESTLNLVGNAFNGNSGGSALIEDAFLLNEASVRSGAAGNTWGSDAPGLLVTWRGLIEVQNGAGAPIPGATCDLSGVGLPNLSSDDRGLCPGYGSGSALYLQMPDNHALWPAIPQTRIDAGGVVFHYDASTSQPVEVAASGRTADALFSWNGIRSDDPASRRSTVCGASGCVNAEVAGRARFQAARVLLYFDPLISFLDGNAQPTSVYREEATAYVRFEDFDLNQDPDFPDLATAVVRNQTNGDSETIFLIETDKASGVFLGGIRLSTTTVMHTMNGKLRAVEGDILTVTAWDTIDPMQPSATKTARVQNVTDGILRFLSPAGDPVERVDPGLPIRIELVDADRNQDPLVVETLPATQLVLRNLTLNPPDREELVLVETGPDTGVFRAAVTAVTSRTAVVGDGLLQGGYGDELQAAWTDPDRPLEKAFAVARLVPPSVPATLRIREPETATVLSGNVRRDQVLLLEIADTGRNWSADAINRITPGNLATAPTELEAIAWAFVRVDSFDASGARIDWAAPTLVETGRNTGVFRAVVGTSSRFGSNTGVVPNSVLRVAPGGRIVFFFRDDDDTSIPKETASLSLAVVEPPEGLDVRFADELGEGRSQLPLAPQRILPFSVLAFSPADATDPARRDQMPGNRIALRNLGNGDRVIPRGTALESAINSGRFDVLVGTDERTAVLSQDEAVQGQVGHVVHVRLVDAANPSDITRWAHDTAMLCRNVQASVRVVDEQGNRLERLVPGTRVRVQVADRDQDADRTRRETVAVDLRTRRLADEERLLAVETEVDSGIFEVEIFLQPAGDAVPGDRRLRVDGADEVTILYEDLDVIVGDAPECQTTDRRELRLTVRAGDRQSDLVFIDSQGKVVEDLRPGQPVRLRLKDGNANLDFSRTETAAVIVFRDDARLGRPAVAGDAFAAILRETDLDTGIFEGAPELPGWVAAAPSFDPTLGMWVSARYEDPDNPEDRIVISAPVVAAPLAVTLTTRPGRGSVGDAVLIEAVVYNPNPFPTIPASLFVRPFPGVPATRGGVRLDGREIATPSEAPWQVPLGVVRGGAVRRLVWTAAVSPRATAEQRAWAEVHADGVRLSERAEAVFRVMEEPIFTLSTVFFHVFEDLNENGRRDFGEAGVGGVRLVAGDGLATWTDEDGLAHLASLQPGPDAFRLDVRSLPPGWSPVGSGHAYVDLRPGMLHAVSFGVRAATEVVDLPAGDTPWRELRIGQPQLTVPVQGSLDNREIIVGRRRVPLVEAGLSLASSAPDALYLSEVERAGGVRIRPLVRGDKALGWTLSLFAEGASTPLRVWSATGAPPPEMRLALAAVRELIRAGRSYAVQLVVDTEGGRATSARLPFRVFDDPPRQELGFAANFGSGESGLDPKTIVALRDAATMLRRFPSATVLIEGFTDDRGPRALNIELSRRRAEKAREYLELVEGVDPARVEVRGIGPERFLMPNDSDENRAQNRRVEISVFGVPAGRAEEQPPELRFAGESRRVDRQGRFTVPGEVTDGRLPLAVTWPDGGTYVTAIGVPPVAVTHVAEVLFGPAFLGRFVVAAPPGSEVHGFPEPLTVGPSGVTAVALPLAGVAELRLQVLVPGDVTTTWQATMTLVPPSAPPPGYGDIDLSRFLSLNLPRADQPLRTGSQRLSGRALPGTELRIDGRRVAVGTDGSFVAPIEVTPGVSFALAVSAEHPRLGLKAAFERSWAVEDPGLLAVGVVDLHSTHVREADHASGDFRRFWEHGGSARFYIEGTIKGEALLKARLRTADTTVEEFLPTLLKWQGSAADLIDPERTYPVYGDAATSVDLAPAAGPLYLLLGWRDQVLEVGTIEVDDGPSRLDDGLDRAYGARVGLSSAPLMPTAPTELDVWGTQPQSAFAQDRLAVTGGLIYRLRHGDVEEGSLRILLQEEDTVTGTMRTLRELQLGVDVDVDWLSGRLWLLKPVSIGGPGSAVVRDDTLPGGTRWIVADYRWRPLDPLEAAGHGERFVQRIGDHGEAGVHYREEHDDGDLSRRGRTWLVVRPVTDTTVDLEFGRRWGRQLERATSLDGGLLWDVTSSTVDTPSNAWAGGVRSRIGPVEIEADGRHLDAGYGSLRYGNSGYEDAARLGFAWQVTDEVHTGLAGEFSDREGTAISEERLWAEYPAGPFVLRNEARTRQDLRGAGDRGDLGARLTLPLPPRWTVWGEHQQQVFGTPSGGAATMDFRSGLGAEYAINATWSVFSEVYAGNRDRGGRLGGAMNHRSTSLQASYGVVEDIASGDLAGVAGVGGRQDVGSKVSLNGAEEVRHGDRERGHATIAGTTVRPITGLSLAVEGEMGRFVTREDDRLFERRAARGLAGLTLGAQRLDARLGWTRAFAAGLDIEGRSADTSWRSRWNRIAETLLRFRYARETSRPTDELLARYQEWGLGAAWRPVDHDRLQMLAMARWARELLPPDRDPSRTELTGILASLDGALRLGRAFEIGAKLGGKRTGVQWAGLRTDPVHTLLTAGRIAWIFYEPFDILGEYRLWRQFETGITEHGPLVELGVRPARYVRFAMGWNFTSFDDELRPHDRFDREGFRLRLQGLF